MCMSLFVAKNTLLYSSFSESAESLDGLEGIVIKKDKEEV